MNGDRLARWTAVAAVLAVAAVAAVISYRHAVAVVTAHGEPGAVGRMYPVTIDGLIVAASMVLLDAARHRESAPRLAWHLLGAGIGATLAVNVLAGLPHGWLAALIASWPAGAFVGSYELLMMIVRASSKRAANPQAGTVPQAVPGSAEAAALASMRATLAAGNPWSANALSTQFGLPRKTASELRERVLAEADGHHPLTA
ncbi:DUF2637 domain-containing protein [Trebonia sp.]|uniref:DUF2637 domain-containing protein n=1 Tax=Trebonia sp. TaxID=2767075 RepID=UPI002638AAC4|nr:DUF2637 domain-containing protein [Trebonia sp.]